MCRCEIDLFELCVIAHVQTSIDANPVHIERARDRGAAQVKHSADVSSYKSYIIGKFCPTHGQVIVDLSSGCIEPAENLRAVERNLATSLDCLEIGAILKQAPVEPKIVPKFGIPQIDCFRETRAYDPDAETRQGAAIFFFEQNGL